MKIQQFLAHHGITENPFGQEDAQSDHVFKQFLLDGTHHPAWDKIYGNSADPSTAVVFGEKGSGKTALRLQIGEQLKEHNRQNPDRRVWVIEYDDFNPFLDSFRDRLHGRRRRPERALANWRLWDHMDAILAIGVRQLVKSILDSRGSAAHAAIGQQELDRLTRLQKRDVLLLAAFYDHTYEQPKLKRWHELRRRLRYSTWWSKWDIALGILVTIATVVLVWTLSNDGFYALFQWWVAAIIAAGWVPWIVRQGRLMYMAWRVKRQIRVFDHLPNTLRRVLSNFDRAELAGQPIPSKDRSDDRYELMMKLQSILETLGYGSIVVLVDRVDEPHLINGSAERMRDFLWPMFDNKFLKHPGIGFKLLLPVEVKHFLDREEREFYERSRLDKQNLVPSLVWTGQSLYDIANDRIRACAKSNGPPPTVASLFEEGVQREELIADFARFRVPRHLFKFLYRLLVEHCNRYTDDNPKYHVSRETLQSTYAVFLRDLDAFDRGMGTG